MQALSTFHTEHYIAPKMKAVIVGRHSIQDLRTLAHEAFGSVRSAGQQGRAASSSAGSGAAAHGGSLLQEAAAVLPVNGEIHAGSTSPGAAAAHVTPKRRVQGIAGLPAGQTKAGAAVTIGNAYEPSDISPSAIFPAASTLAKVVRVSPIAESHTISIVWPLPSQLHRYRRNPAGYLSSLLGDEGEGSILAHLKGELGLVEEISAGLQLDSAGFSLMGVDMTLSPTAMRGSKQEQEEVLQQCLQAVFAYCNMLRRLQAPPKWIWDESMQVSAAAFRYYVKGSPSDIASSMARSLHVKPPIDVLGPPQR